MKPKTLYLALLAMFLPALAFADLTMTALTPGQINTYVGYLNWASAFHIGGSLIPALLILIAHWRGWLGTPAGMASLDDFETILGAAKDYITKTGQASKHPDLAKAVTVLNVGIQDAQAAALPPKAPSAGAKGLLLFFGLMALAGMARADVTSTAATTPAPVAGWCAGPSFGAGSSIWLGNRALQLVPTNFVYGDVAYAFYTGSWQGGVFQPAWFVQAQASLGTNAGDQGVAAGGTAGYYIGPVGYGITVQRRFDLGAPTGGFIGVSGSYQFSGYIPFLYAGNPGN